MPRVQGTVTRWKSTYGFVSHPDSDLTVFIHESDMENQQRPEVGSQITYTMATDPKNGKPRAYSCRFQAGASSDHAPKAPGTYCGHAVTDLIKASKRIMSILKHKDSQTWLTTEEIQTKLPQSMRPMVQVALDFELRPAIRASTLRVQRQESGGVPGGTCQASPVQKQVPQPADPDRT